MRRSKGFTLIELMIVIAIIAIIAAIAIPGLLSSQRASNERNASASLKTMATAEADFRSNDRDGNKISDYWTANVAGLYTMTSAAISGTANDTPLKLIELSIAGAESDATAVTTTGTNENNPITTYATTSPKAGYWYWALISDNSPGTAQPYQVDTGGTPAMGSVHNNSRFGFMAYPDAFGSSGKLVFIINENNTMFKRQPSADIKFDLTANPPGSITDTEYVDWPSDTVLKSDWGKMD